MARCTDGREERLYAIKAEVLKAMAHPLRLAVVDFLAGGERCVCEIAEELEAGQSNVSRHLALMVTAGVLTHRKEGLKVYYSLRTRCVLSFLECVEGVIRARVEDERALLGER